MASASTRLKSPAFISSASSLRPVGLIRSPIITNGRPNPITTSRVAELRTVSVIAVVSFGIVAVVEFLERHQFVLVDVVVGHVGDEPAGVGELAEVLLRVLGLERRRLRLGGEHVVVAGLARAVPLGDVLFGGVDAGLALGAVDGALELRRQQHLVALAPVLAVDLRRDVAPIDGDDLAAARLAARHQATLRCTLTDTASANGSRPTWTCSNSSPSISAALRPASSTAGSSVCESSTTRR